MRILLKINNLMPESKITTFSNNTAKHELIFKLDD